MIFKTQDINKFNLQSDLRIIQDVLDVSDNQLAVETEIPVEIINKLLKGDITTVDKNTMENIYNFAFNNGLYLTNIKHQLYSEEFNDDDNLVLCHGSRNKIVGALRLDANNDASNDFANGFYCGQFVNQAGMFVSMEPDSCLYIAKAKLNDLMTTSLGVTTDWLIAVSYFRNTLINYDVEDLPIIKKCKESDLIIAPIADNRMFELIDQFLNGVLTDMQCIHAISATSLGFQYVFKTEKALQNVELLERCYLCSSEKGYYNRNNETESNTGLTKAKLSKLLYKNEGKYISEIL